MKRNRIYLLIAALITVFIFANSAQSAQESSEISGGILAFLSRLLSGTGITVSHYFVRKAAHFTEFFMQSLFLSLAAKNSRIGIFGGAVHIAFAGLLTACCDEYLQLFVEGRGSQVADVFIDFSGTVTALVTVIILYLIKRRQKSE